MHIDTLTIPVEENMTVQIVWSRGAKKVPTKKRMLQANAQTAHFGEKFAISTNMDLNSTTMKPTKQKLSKLQVLSNKPKGVIGTADLDLANYGEGEPKCIHLDLQNCQYEGSFIELKMLGTVEVQESPKSHRSESSKSARGSKSKGGKLSIKELVDE